jgi:hypothetical protein
MKYWHEISKEEYEKLKIKGKIDLNEFVKEYKQPDWCNYPEALRGKMGCWSLFYHPEIINKEYCKDCNECNLNSF